MFCSETPCIFNCVKQFVCTTSYYKQFLPSRRKCLFLNIDIKVNIDPSSPTQLVYSSFLQYTILCFLIKWPSLRSTFSKESRSTLQRDYFPSRHEQKSMEKVANELAYSLTSTSSIKKRNLEDENIREDQQTGLVVCILRLALTPFYVCNGTYLIQNTTIYYNEWI